MNVLTAYVRNVMNMFFSVCGSMVMGIRTLSRPNVTTEYPRKEKWDVPDGSRMKLYNNIDDCIGCYKCSRICPTDCIEIETIKAPDSVDLGTASTGNPLNFWLPKFDIDMVKCCYCDLCTTVCPTECLVMTKTYEGSAYDRGNLVYHFGNVDSEEMEEIQQLLRGDEGDGAAAAGTAEEEAAESEAGDEPSSVMGKLIPESIEGLPLQDRIRARLISRGKLEGDLPEGAEIDESASPPAYRAGEVERPRPPPPNHPVRTRKRPKKPRKPMNPRSRKRRKSRRRKGRRKGKRPARRKKRTKPVPKGTTSGTRISR